MKWRKNKVIKLRTRNINWKRKRQKKLENDKDYKVEEARRYKLEGDKASTNEEFWSNKVKRDTRRKRKVQVVVNNKNTDECSGPSKSKSMCIYFKFPNVFTICHTI